MFSVVSSFVYLKYNNWEKIWNSKKQNRYQKSKFTRIFNLNPQLWSADLFLNIKTFCLVARQWKTVNMSNRTQDWGEEQEFVPDWTQSTRTKRAEID